MGFDQQYRRRKDFCSFPLRVLKKACFSFLPYKRNKNDVWQLLKLELSDDPQLGTEKNESYAAPNFPSQWWESTDSPIRKIWPAGPDQTQTPSGQIYHMAAGKGCSIHPHFPPFRNHQFVKKRFIFKPEPFPKFPPR